MATQIKKKRSISRANAKIGSSGTELAVPGGSPSQGAFVGRNPTYFELGSHILLRLSPESM